MSWAAQCSKRRLALVESHTALSGAAEVVNLNGNHPLKVAVAYQAPLAVVEALMTLYPAATRRVDLVRRRAGGGGLSLCSAVTPRACVTQFGDNLLHVAVNCGARADVVAAIVRAFPEAAMMANNVRAPRARRRFGSCVPPYTCGGGGGRPRRCHFTQP